MDIPCVDRCNAEAVLLGTVLAYPAAAEFVIAGMEPDDFTDAHRDVCAVILDLIAAGRPCHPIIVAAALTDTGRRPMHRRTHWLAVLADLTNEADVPALAPHLRRVILGERLRRDVTDIGATLTAVAPTADVTHLHQVLNNATSAIATLIARSYEVAMPGRKPSSN